VPTRNGAVSDTPAGRHSSHTEPGPEPPPVPAAPPVLPVPAVEPAPPEPGIPAFVLDDEPAALALLTLGVTAEFAGAVAALLLFEAPLCDPAPVETCAAAGNCAASSSAAAIDAMRFIPWQRRTGDAGSRRRLAAATGLC
jgi:hypothetical protein